MRETDRYPEPGIASGRPAAPAIGDAPGVSPREINGMPAGPSYLYDSIYNLLRQKILGDRKSVV